MSMLFFRRVIFNRCPMIAVPIELAKAALKVFWIVMPWKNSNGNGSFVVAVSREMAKITYPKLLTNIGRKRYSFGR
jgi:hypothetical protein